MLSDSNGIDWVRTVCVWIISSFIVRSQISRDWFGICLTFASQINSMLSVIYQLLSSLTSLQDNKIWLFMAFWSFTIETCLKASKVRKLSQYCCRKREISLICRFSSWERSHRVIFTVNLFALKHFLGTLIVIFGSSNLPLWIEVEEFPSLAILRNSNSWYGSIIKVRDYRTISKNKGSQNNSKSDAHKFQLNPHSK